MQVTPTGSDPSVEDPVLTGAPAQERLRKPVNVLPDVIVATTFALCPGDATEIEVGAILSAKLSALGAACAITLSDCEPACAESPP